MARNSFFAEQMSDPAYAAEVVTARARIDSIDTILRTLDGVRQEKGLSKAELARRAGRKEAFVRRLFTGANQNPTLETVIALAHELELEICLTARSSL